MVKSGHKVGKWPEKVGKNFFGQISAQKKWAKAQIFFQKWAENLTKIYSRIIPKIPDNDPYKP